MSAYVIPSAARPRYIVVCFPNPSNFIYFCPTVRVKSHYLSCKYFNVGHIQQPK